MDYKRASEIAEKIMKNLKPYCEQVEVAGSIRRRAREVKDIEIVVAPRKYKKLDMFGDVVMIYEDLRARWQGLGWQEGGDRWLKNGERYKQVMLAEGIKLDLFIVLPPAQWGVIFALRTGPAGFSKWLVTKRAHGGALPNYMSIGSGALWVGDELIETPTEGSFFDEIGLKWIEPWYREEWLKERVMKWTRMS